MEVTTPVRYRKILEYIIKLMNLQLQAAKWDFDTLPDYCLFLKQNFPLRLHIHKLQLKWNHKKKPLTEIAIETIDIFYHFSQSITFTWGIDNIALLPSRVEQVKNQKISIKNDKLLFKKKYNCIGGVFCRECQNQAHIVSVLKHPARFL